MSMLPLAIVAGTVWAVVAAFVLSLVRVSSHASRPARIRRELFTRFDPANAGAAARRRIVGGGA